MYEQAKKVIQEMIQVLEKHPKRDSESAGIHQIITNAKQWIEKYEYRKSFVRTDQELIELDMKKDQEKPELPLLIAFEKARENILYKTDSNSKERRDLLKKLAEISVFHHDTDL